MLPALALSIWLLGQAALAATVELVIDTTPGAEEIDLIEHALREGDIKCITVRHLVLSKFCDNPWMN